MKIFILHLEFLRNDVHAFAYVISLDCGAPLPTLDYGDPPFLTLILLSSKFQSDILLLS